MDIEAEAKRLGYSVTVASDPNAALELAKTVLYTAAFVDATLREPFDGLDVARAFARDTRARVVILTGYSPTELAGHMDGLAGVPVLYKPTEQGAILSFLQSLVSVA
jgi:ActR/RegA family two-component response regulator